MNICQNVDICYTPSTLRHYPATRLGIEDRLSVKSTINSMTSAPPSNTPSYSTLAGENALLGEQLGAQAEAIRQLAHQLGWFEKQLFDPKSAKQVDKCRAFFMIRRPHSDRPVPAQRIPLPAPCAGIACARGWRCGRSGPGGGCEPVLAG